MALRTEMAGVIVSRHRGGARRGSDDEERDDADARGPRALFFEKKNGRIPPLGRGCGRRMTKGDLVDRDCEHEHP